MTIPRNYDLLGAIDTLFPGIVVQGPLIQAANNQLISKNAALDSTDVVTILTAANVIIAAQKLAGYVPTTESAYPLVLPTYPTGLPRFPDANGGMTTPGGWNRTWAAKVVEA